MLRPIRTREELLEVAIRLSPTRACARAITQGGLRNHGGYTLPNFPPLFAVTVTTQHRHQYQFWILANEIGWTRYETNVLPMARYWDGRPGGRSVIDGDDA